MFYCIRCGHQFDRKGKLKRHYYRERVCKPIELDIDIGVLKEVLEQPDDNLLRHKLQGISYELYCKYLENLLKKRPELCDQKYIPDGPNGQNGRAVLEKNITNSTLPRVSISNMSNIHKKTQILICRFCTKQFGSYSARIRHEKYRCTNNNSDTTDNSISDSEVEIIENTNDETIINDTCIEDFLEGVDREELLDIITNDASFICDLKNKLDKTISSSKHNSNNIHNKYTNSNSHNTNITNNTINNNSNSHNTFNNTNNTNVTINQNTYGNEDFGYIVNNTSIRDGLGRLADNNPKRFFTELFRTAFFNKQHPENKTFKMINPKSNLVKILEKLPDNWIYASKTETYYDKVRQILTFITDHTNIVTEDSKTEKMIDEFGCDRDKTLLREFETMECTNYKNNQLKEVRDLAELMNKHDNILTKK